MTRLGVLALTCVVMFGFLVSGPAVAKGRVRQGRRPSINTRSLSQYFQKYAQMQQAAAKAEAEQAALEEQARLKKKQDGIDRNKARKEEAKQKAAEWAQKQKAKQAAKSAEVKDMDSKSETEKPVSKVGKKTSELDQVTADDAKSVDKKAVKDPLKSADKSKK